MNILQHTRPWDEGGPVALMSDWWVRAHWGRAFEILETKPQFHNFTWVLMRRREVELTTDDLERPEEDPREVAALRNNLRQVQREVEELTRRLDEVRRDYESTLSWRVTKPLRRDREGG
jgi:hypothetical protein